MSLFQVAGSAVREARRAFEDQFRGLPIELVDCKNKFLATSFRYQGISGPPVELVDCKNKLLATSFRYQGISRWRLEDHICVRTQGELLRSN